MRLLDHAWCGGSGCPAPKGAHIQERIARHERLQQSGLIGRAGMFDQCHKSMHVQMVKAKQGCVANMDGEARCLGNGANGVDQAAIWNRSAGFRYPATHGPGRAAGAWGLLGREAERFTSKRLLEKAASRVVPSFRRHRAAASERPAAASCSGAQLPSARRATRPRGHAWLTHRARQSGAAGTAARYVSPTERRPLSKRVMHTETDRVSGFRDAQCDTGALQRILLMTHLH